MTVSKLATVQMLRKMGRSHVHGLVMAAAFAALAGPAAAQLLTMPPPASQAPASTPAPAPAPAAPAPASGSLFGAPAPGPSFGQGQDQKAPPSLFGSAPAASQAAPSAPASMFNSGPAPSAPSAVPAQCESQMSKFQERRQTQMQELDKIVKASKNGKVDPNASCPKLRALASVETEMRNWMTKQQNACGIPNEVMTQMRDATGKTAQIADRACQAAAEMKRQQAGAGAGAPAPAMKLPAGPL